MKKLIIILFIILLVIAGWFGYQQLRRRSMLASGRDVLLVNKSEAVFTYSSTIATEDLTSAFKVIGYVDDLSEQEIAKYTEGLQFISSFSDENLNSSQLNDIELEASPDADKNAWLAVEQKMPQAQTDLCARLSRTDFKQACLFRHYMLNLVASASSSDFCAVIYVDAYKKECEDALGKGITHQLLDSDTNNLLDNYEIQVDPYKFDDNAADLNY